MSDPRRRGGSAPSRMSGGRGGSPNRSANTVAAVVVAVVAVLLGVVILQQLKDDDGSTVVGANPSDASGDTTIPGTAPLTVPPVATAVPGQFTVVVANSSGVGKAAGKMSDALKLRGHLTGTPTNATGAEAKTLATTTVYYAPGAEAEGALVATEIGAATAATPLPSSGFPVPTDGIGSASVVVLLGKDLAGKELPAPNPSGITSETQAASGNPNVTTG